MDTLRILVTDDEMGMRLGVARTLRDYIVHVPDAGEDVSFTVDQASTGEEALEKIAQQPPDILLLDHKMPGISGLEVLNRVSEMRLDMLTIMITAYASIETAVTATKRGAYDFLAKPFTPDELKSTVLKAAARLILAKQAKKLAREKQQVRFEFLRVLAHELKAPLNAVAGYLQLMEQHKLGEHLGEYRDMIGRSLVRIDGMNKLIHDLLDLTRIESGKKTRRLGTVDLAAMAEVAAENLRPMAALRKIDITVRSEGDVSLKADPGEIEMLMNNLISNAVKYNEDGGQVDVVLAGGDAQATIAISDTGIGMSPEEIEQIFHEFSRIKKERTNNIPGSGLGLSIVKKIVQLYEGDITVQSRLQEGSTFRITLDSIASPSFR